MFTFELKEKLDKHFDVKFGGKSDCDDLKTKNQIRTP
jgi:hypothetical protein